MSRVRGSAERAALISGADPLAHRAIKAKARKYASFGRYETEDLYQATLQAALEGNPKWRANVTLIDYCDAVRRKSIITTGRLLAVDANAADQSQCDWWKSANDR